jgi:beta-carotene/zeaxanthin 4-ketolase
VGIWISLLLVIAWALSLLGVCSIDLANHSVWWILGLLLMRTFLHTGLFITAHDAMHGSICVNRPRWNRWIGIACTALYALLPYDTLLSNHHLHHQHPATELDPDFSDRGILGWYCKFMGGYIDRPQALKILWGMGAVFSIAHYLLQIPIFNLLLLWVLPILLSSLQLFYFGTFLPHRSYLVGAAESGSPPDHHRARSSSLHPCWSLLTCYHFGYHWEHHEYPQTPWYRLPSVKKM